MPRRKGQILNYTTMTDGRGTRRCSRWNANYHCINIEIKVSERTLIHEFK
jgi:hypothetical protein